MIDTPKDCGTEVKGSRQIFTEELTNIANSIDAVTFRIMRESDPVEREFLRRAALQLLRMQIDLVGDA